MAVAEQRAMNVVEAINCIKLAIGLCSGLQDDEIHSFSNTCKKMVCNLRKKNDQRIDHNCKSRPSEHGWALKRTKLMCAGMFLHFNMLKKKSIKRIQQVEIKRYCLCLDYYSNQVRTQCASNNVEFHSVGNFCLHSLYTNECSFHAMRVFTKSKWRILPRLHTFHSVIACNACIRAHTHEQRSMGACLCAAVHVHLCMCALFRTRASVVHRWYAVSTSSIEWKKKWEMKKSTMPSLETKYIGVRIGKKVRANQNFCFVFFCFSSYRDFYWQRFPCGC